jgi:hypothetical protein
LYGFAKDLVFVAKGEAMDETQRENQAGETQTQAGETQTQTAGDGGAEGQTQQATDGGEQAPKTGEGAMQTQRDEGAEGTMQARAEQTRAEGGAEEALEAPSDEADIEVLVADFDQLDTDIVAFDALVEQEVIVLDLGATDDVQQVHEQRDAAREMRSQFQDADEDSRPRLRTAFKEAIDDLRDTWRRSRAKIAETRQQAEGSKGTEAHP